MIINDCAIRRWSLRSIRVRWIVFLLLGLAVRLSSGAEPVPLRVGSKSFTESVILGEMLACQIRHARRNVEHRAELGGTQVVWKALERGEIDVYVEYTGTLTQEVLKQAKARSLDDIRTQIAPLGIAMIDPLGFNNTYALGMRKERAAQLGLVKISDMKSQESLKLGFSDEFMERGDGWPGLQVKYGLPRYVVRGLDHSLAYRGLVAGSIDVIDLYSTDPEVVTYGLTILEDDLSYFPLYEAVIVYRQELEQQEPQIVSAFRSMAGKINNDQMARLNASSRIDKEPEPLIAARFLQAHVDPTIEIPRVDDQVIRKRFRKFVLNAYEHCMLVSISLTTAILVAIPLGIAAYKFPRFGGWILAVVGVIQTIPSMALLVFMIPVLGLGAKPAIVALFLYSLLPIVRGTYTGLQGLPQTVHESALALGLPGWARLRLVELPLASRSILAGIKTSAVINVGTATIGALIGAGGFGQPILTGIRLADLALILQGAVPAALLALLVQAACGWLERWLVPRGIRLKH